MEPHAEKQGGVGGRSGPIKRAGYRIFAGGLGPCVTTARTNVSLVITLVCDI
jgi:hypothetical protein